MALVGADQFQCRHRELVAQIDQPARDALGQVDRLDPPHGRSRHPARVAPSRFCNRIPSTPAWRDGTLWRKAGPVSRPGKAGVMAGLRSSRQAAVSAAALRCGGARNRVPANDRLHALTLNVRMG